MAAIAEKRFVLPAAVTGRLLFVTTLDAALLWLIVRLLHDGAFPLAAILTFIAVFVTASFSIQRMKAYRWLSVGLSLSILFVLYPVLYTIYLSTTNTSGAHILTKQQAIDSLGRQTYIPEDGREFGWTAFRADDGSFALWLTSEDGTAYFATVGAALAEAAAGENGIGPLDANGVPEAIEGYTRLERRDLLVLLDTLSAFDFGAPPTVVKVASLSSAATTVQRYTYDAERDVLTDRQTDIEYRPVQGTFVAETGEELRPGFFVDIGADNFTRFFSSSALRGPLLTVVVWNFAYAILSVVFSFALGLFIAVLFDQLPGKRLIRMLLIIPYPIPALVSILIWRNLLNPDFGVLVKLQESLFGSAPNWLTDPNATRAAIILINVWLSYPYFYIVSSGALQAIPGEMLDAAAVDGANVWQKFWRITFPLLLTIVSPLLIASFAFNFNNFNLIYIFNEGNPPIAGAPLPIGHTDILISFVYTLGFDSGQTQYGLAAAISLVLFAFVAVITWLQFRYTRVLEEKF